MEIAQKNIVVIGAQRTGLALLKLIKNRKGLGRLSALSAEADIHQELRIWISENNVECEFDGHTKTFIEACDLVVTSPAVRQTSEVLQWAKEAAIPVLGEIEFAFQFCQKPLIAVTGSNGKTTVTTLIHQMLAQAGYRSCLCGNCGDPFSNYVTASVEYDYFCVEVSSFQLESVITDESDRLLIQKHFDSFKGLKPKMALLLNFSQNHLDRHKDLEEYFQAKCKLFINQDHSDFALINQEEEYYPALLHSIKAKIHPFNLAEDKERYHNDPNLSVLSELARILDIDQKVCRSVYGAFEGVEHRLEWVRQIDGIDFVNDSKATTAESCRWALGHIDQPIVMICGGKDKNIDYSVLSDDIKNHVKRMFIIGEAKEKISKAFASIIQTEECEQLSEAVLKARQSASRGDCIVFSPMCSSFDMFGDFEERGRAFKNIVKEL